jgi:hypothetical protein
LPPIVLRAKGPRRIKSVSGSQQQVDPRPWRQDGEPLQQLQRIEAQMRDAIGPPVSKRQPDLPIRSPVQSLIRGGEVIREELERVDEPFLVERSIDIDTYDRHAEKLRQELALARMDRHASELDELDVEGILAFAERVLPRAADLWVQASLEQRQRFQQLFFPEGIAFDGNGFCSNRRNHTGFQLLAGE